MLYLLLIFFPISMAASCFVLRKRTDLVIVTAVGATLTEMILVSQILLDQPVRLLGVTLTLTALSRLFIMVFLCIGALSFITSWHLPHGENFVPVVLLTLALTATTLLLQDLFIVALLLVGAGIAAVLAIVDLPPGAGVLIGTRTIAAALKYLVLMLIAGVLMYLSFVLADIYRPGEVPGRVPLTRFILALLAGGIALRLALIPFHSWLVDLVEDAAPMVSALIIAIINTTSFLVLILALQIFPVLLIENPVGVVLLRVGGIVTSVLGGLLALGQPSMRRTLAYLLIYNSGMVFYGLASVSTIGLSGAVFEVLNQTLAITLMFVSLGLLERPDGRPPSPNRRDLLRRWPIAGVGFLGGGLALVGIPPFNGFASKMLIYEAALQQGPIELLGLLLATALGLLALVRMAHQYLLGPSEDAPVIEPALLGETELDRPAPRRLKPEPRSTAVLTLLLLVTCLAIGCYPQPLLDVIGEATRGLAFVRIL